MAARIGQRTRTEVRRRTSWAIWKMRPGKTVEMGIKDVRLVSRGVQIAIHVWGEVVRAEETRMNQHWDVTGSHFVYNRDGLRSVLSGLTPRPSSLSRIVESRQRALSRRWARVKTYTHLRGVGKWATLFTPNTCREPSTCALNNPTVRVQHNR